MNITWSDLSLSTSRLLTSAAFILFRTSLLAQTALAQTAPPPIALHVEQPAYTGLPIWLHVITRDECFENASPTYPWFEYLWLRDDGAEVTKDGRHVAGIPFRDIDPGHHVRIPGLQGCPNSMAFGPEHDHRFALSGAAIFDQPGHYRVRWTTRTNSAGQEEIYDMSDWVDFTVQPSTADQLATWLASVLPADDLLPDLGPETSIVYDYIPSLVVGWRDPRVARKLLDLACSGPKDVSIAAAEALQYDMTAAIAVYFGSKVTDGCLWTDFSMSEFILRHARELSSVRTELLRGLEAHFDHPNLGDPELEDALAAMAAVRTAVAANPGDTAVNIWADDKIMRLSPRIITPHDADGMNYTDMSFGNLVTYLSHDHLSTKEHALLRMMAADDDSGIRAFEELAALKDPADLEFLGTTLGNRSGTIPGNYLTDLDTIVSTFGVKAVPMLRIVATNSKAFYLRDHAASYLITFGQPDGTRILDESMRSSYWVERRNAAHVLDRLVKQHVSISTLQHFCTKSDPDDPCGASDILTPPGQCEPHFACRVSGARTGQPAASH